MLCMYDGPFGKVFIYVFKSLEKRYIKVFSSDKLQVFHFILQKKIVMNTFYFHNKK